QPGAGHVRIERTGANDGDGLLVPEAVVTHLTGGVDEPAHKLGGAGEDLISLRNLGGGHASTSASPSISSRSLCPLRSSHLRAAARSLSDSRGPLLMSASLPPLKTESRFRLLMPPPPQRRRSPPRSPPRSRRPAMRHRRHRASGRSSAPGRC